MIARVVHAHPRSKDKTIKLTTRRGYCEIIVLKSNLYNYFKRSFQAASSGAHGYLGIHSENGIFFSYSYAEIRDRYKSVIVHL